MLAEARGYRVAITLAHQHLGQLPRELRDGISTNARSKIFFTASPEDARELARHTTPRLTDHDLAHLGAFHAAVRVVLHGEQTEPFTIRTQPLPRPIPGRARHIRTITRQTLRTPNAGPVPATHSSTTAASSATRGARPVAPPRGADPRRTS
jgi:hypothetical protein